MASVSRALQRIKQDIEEHVPAGMIEAACRDAGHSWRERKFGPVRTIHLFVLQVLNFNTAIRHLRHLAGHAVSQRRRVLRGPRPAAPGGDAGAAAPERGVVA